MVNYNNIEGLGPVKPPFKQSAPEVPKEVKGKLNLEASEGECAVTVQAEPTAPFDPSLNTSRLAHLPPVSSQHTVKDIGEEGASPVPTPPREESPDLNLPKDLPGLEGVADIEWKGEEAKPIIPADLRPVEHHHEEVKTDRIRESAQHTVKSTEGKFAQLISTVRKVVNFSSPKLFNFGKLFRSYFNKEGRVEAKIEKLIQKRKNGEIDRATYQTKVGQELNKPGIDKAAVKLNVTRNFQGSKPTELANGAGTPKEETLAYAKSIASADVAQARTDIGRLNVRIGKTNYEKEGFETVMRGIEAEFGEEHSYFIAALLTQGVLAGATNTLYREISENIGEDPDDALMATIKAKGSGGAGRSFGVKKEGDQIVFTLKDFAEVVEMTEDGPVKMGHIPVEKRVRIPIDQVPTNDDLKLDTPDQLDLHTGGMVVNVIYHPFVELPTPQKSSGS